MGIATTDRRAGVGDAQGADLASPRREEWVTDARRFAELRDPWNRLATDNLFLTWDWLDCWWRSFGMGARMRVHVSWDGPELAGGIAFGLRGRHLVAIANAATDLFRPVARSEPDLHPALRPVSEGPWSRITLRGLPGDDPATQRLREVLGSDGWLVDEKFRERCPIVSTKGKFEDYLRGLSAKTRSNDRRARRRLEREGRVELRAIEPVGQLEPVLAESFAVEAAGWKGRSNKAILSSERRARFWRALFERFHRLGGVRFSELRLDGTLIAFSLDVVHEGRLYGLKTSYDERYAFLGPGNVLLMEMIERGFKGDLQAIEMLGPTSPRKERYATEARDTVQLRAYRRRPGSLARYGARRWMVPWLRPIYVRPRNALDRVGERGLRGLRATQDGGQCPPNSGPCRPAPE